MQRNRSAHAAWGRCVFVGNLIRNLTLHLRVTIYMKKCKIGTKWLFFFTFIEECCVVIEKNIDKKFANRISY